MRRPALFILSILCVCSLAAVGVGASAMTASPPPYSGGTPIARVLYPADGSTITITTSGAVIKQSPNGTPYRQGWINPAGISNINSMTDLNGKIMSGSTNPYVAQVPMPPPSNTSASATASSATKVVLYRTQPSSVAQYSGSTSTSPPASYHAPSSTTVPSSSATTTAAYTNTASIPNTGPGNILAIGSLTTIVSAVGHFFFQRFRNGY